MHCGTAVATNYSNTFKGEKVKLIFTSLAASLLFFNTFALAEQGPSKIKVNFGKIYVAQGFDSNDRVQIVGEGIYNNGCYRNAETKVRIDHDQRLITLSPFAYKYDGLCIQVLLPFDRVVDIGILKSGTYRVKQEGQSSFLGDVVTTVAATRNPDDFPYAPISQAFFRSSVLGNIVTLSGEFPSSCMFLKEVKFDVQPDVLVVQPIAQMDERADCKAGKFYFEKDTDVGAMKPGRYLLHVRSMNGKAINSLVEVQK